MHSFTTFFCKKCAHPLFLFLLSSRLYVADAPCRRRVSLVNICISDYIRQCLSWLASGTSTSISLVSFLMYRLSFIGFPSTFRFSLFSGSLDVLDFLVIFAIFVGVSIWVVFPGFFPFGIPTFAPLRSQFFSKNLHQILVNEIMKFHSPNEK